jgi:recombination protein RecA
MYGQGVSKVGELVDLGVKANIVEKSGSWYSYDGSRIGQGREAAKEFLRTNPEVADRIEKTIRAASGQIGENLVLDASEKAEDE